jgi:penicillin-binding protein A
VFSQLSGGGIRHLAAAVILLLVGCTQDGSEAPRAEDAARSFFDAWSQRNAIDMVAAFDQESRREWSAAEVETLLEESFDPSIVETLIVDGDGPVDEPDVADGETPNAGAMARVPYSLTFDFVGIERPATLEGGSLELTYQAEEGAWKVSWAEELLWPGIGTRASAFEIRSELPKRAPILDRDGKKLARGSGASRSYPYGALAGSTVGHVEPVGRKALRDEGSGYEAGDLMGGSGLEAGLEERLAGKPATIVSVVDDRGRRLEVVARTAGRRARPVTTTLDVDVQRAAEAAYGGTTGGAVVIDPQKGDLLAIVSSAQINPNSYVGVAGIEPFNRATSGLYPPGSAMKVVTAGAALDTGVVKPTTRLSGPKEYKGVRNFESGQYSSLDFATAVKFSVNTAFAQVAEDLGARQMTRYAEAFGFNRRPALPLEAARSSFPFPEDLSDLMWGSIGQAQVLATPLQMATVAATVANRGKRMEPRITLEDARSGERAISRATARVLSGLMENVVEGGTGSAARVSGLRIAGKTGTAEVDVEGKRKNHAWFVAFAPVENPQVAVGVVSELGGIGGQVAAPLARQIILGVLPHVR